MRISVALCTCNGGFFLRKQLESILNQTIKVDEIIVCDDKSTDKTLEILKEYAAKFSFIKIFINPKRIGAVKNFEKSIKLTSGDFIFLADQDDVWLSHKVERIIQFFSNNEKCQLVFSDALLIDEHDKTIQGTLWEKWMFNQTEQNHWTHNINAFEDLIVNRNKVTGATICFRASLKNNIIPIDIPQGYWHDAWLAIHAAATNGLMFINEPLIKYRIHEGQQVGLSQKIKKFNEKGSVSKALFYLRLSKMYPQLIFPSPEVKNKSICFLYLKNKLFKLRTIIRF